MKNRILPLLLAALLLMPLLKLPASAAEPAPLTLSFALEGQRATVSVAAAGAITLSNYDMLLSWDGAAFTLTGIANARSSLFPHFQANDRPGDPGAGMIAAISGGGNVTVAAGEILAVWSFAVAEDAAGSYAFTLTVSDAAAEDGSALAWKGASVSCGAELTGGGITPAPLELRCLAEEEGVTAAIVATEAVTLSNYDMLLRWDGEVFTLAGIANSQSSLFPNFQANDRPGDPGAGMIAAASGGGNVTLAAGETLAVYAFTPADGADVTAPFTLTVREAADMDGLSLAWKGAKVSGHAVPRPEIREIEADGMEITVRASCDRDDAALILASYTAGGRLIEVFTAPVTVGTGDYGFTLTEPGGCVKAFLTDGDARPLCRMMRDR